MLTGILILLAELKLIDLTITKILIMDLSAFGILAVYIGFERGSRSLIAISTTAFLIGIFLFVTNNYELFTNSKIYILALLFISATNFLMLYLENPKSAPLLFASILIYLVAAFSVTLLKNSYITYISNGLVNMLIEYWPVFLLFFGINILSNSRK